MSRFVYFSLCALRNNLNKPFSFTQRYCSTSASTNGDFADQLVVRETLGAVATIGINRPGKRNCVNSKTAEALLKALQEFDEDDSVSVAVLHGIGGNFCAGYDLEELSGASDKDPSSLLPDHRGPMGPSRMLTKKPLVAAISGYAVAGGMELALMCDLRVMEETAVMGVFCRRFGVPLIDGGTVRLPALVGLSRAMDLILTGRAIGAKEAFEWGLANRITQVGTAFGQAVNLANSLTKFPQGCLQVDRNSAHYAMFSAKSFEDALAYEYSNGKQILALESVVGAKKFVEGMGRHGKFHLDKLKDDGADFD